MINSKSPGKTSGKRERERKKERMEGQRGWQNGEKDAGWLLSFWCLSYHRADEGGLISSPLARQDGVKSWISRPICTSPPSISFPPFFFSFPFFFRSPFSPITQPLERGKCSEWPLSPFIFAVAVFHPTGDSTSIIT